MPPETDPGTDPLLAEWAEYLRGLNAAPLDPRLRGRFGLSDVAQDTLWEAYRDRGRIRRLDPAGQRRYLRRMFLNNLRDAVDRELAGRRDPSREAALRSSGRYFHWVPGPDSSPSHRAAEAERDEAVRAAVESLPERERRAVTLQYFRGWRLAEIAADMGCTVGAVAGLLARGQDRLRHRLRPAGG